MGSSWSLAWAVSNVSGRGFQRQKHTLEPSMLARTSHGRPLIPAVSACTLTRKQEAVVDTRDKHVSRAPHEAASTPCGSLTAMQGYCNTRQAAGGRWGRNTDGHVPRTRHRGGQGQTQWPRRPANGVKAQVAPQIEKYQFHPCHGCPNPLLPLVGRFFWTIPALLRVGREREH